MTDQDKWNNAVALLSAEYASLSAAFQDELRCKSQQIMELKAGLHRFAESVNGEAICASCQGACCACGKYHFTVIDTLIYLATSKPLFIPRFGVEHCPYLGDAGCLMEPATRPFNCVTFNCERIEGVLEPSELERFYAMGKVLRLRYREIEELFGGRYMHGLLMNFERDVLAMGRPLLGERVRSYGDRH